MVEIQHRGPSEQARRVERLAFVRNVPNRAKEITRDPAFLQYTRDHIKEFRQRVTTGDYSDSDQRLILGALDLAIVAYQDNDNKKLRQRQQTVVYNNQEVNIPYIQHPLSVAFAMIGEPRRIKLHTSGDKVEEIIEIDVRQDPYKAEVIAAALLHDVFEDSKIKLPSGDILEGTKKWSEVIKAYLNFTEANSLDSVLTMISAVTKYSDIPKGLLQTIKESTVFDTVTSTLDSLGHGNKTSDDIESEVARSLSDLHKMIAVSFGIGGDIHFEEENFQNFFGALAIKCHDVENNLEDARVRDDKLIRAHILATFARLFGLPVASRMAAHLIVSNQFDMFWGTGDRLRNLKEGKETVSLYGYFESIRHRPEFTIAGQKLKVDAIQLPIPTKTEIAPPDQENSDLGITNDFRSVLQYRMTEANSEVLDLIERAYNEADEFNPIEITYINDKGRTEKYLGYPIREQVQTEILDSERRCYYFKVYRKPSRKNQEKPRLAGIYRIQDNQPSAHEVLKLGSTVKATDVAETAYIKNNYDGDPASCMEIFSI